MDRLIRLNQLWSWLPAFRAVAETQHVHEAAARVHLTPSTLSRAIRMLEDDLGRPLFRRVGRSLALTDDGQELLQALRDAMRRLDDAVVTVTGHPTAPFRVAAEDAVTLAGVVDAIATSAGTEPPEVLAVESDPAAALRRGSVDVVFATEAQPARDVHIERVGDIVFSSHAAPSLVGALPSTREALASQPWIDAPGLPWPPELRRRVRVRVANAAVALAACRAGVGLAMVPDGIAADLVRVRDRDGEPLVAVHRPVYAIRRTPRLANDAASMVIAAVRARFAQPVRNVAMEPIAASA